ncbi:hypothetical protein CN072_33005 [Sinorhizobium meliloti]|nr:hypothetical protein CN218_34150 [Sinorhizobium meliloti]RVP76976.1 hypothetical protein CN072_33005 [Sinorhizobium meliloti]
MSRSRPSSACRHLLPACGEKGIAGSPSHHLHTQARRGVRPLSPHAAGESHLANKRLFCCGKSILGVLR